ncbi:hypothetical protein Tco_0324964 [Tanacetum coccineum]
MDSKIPIGQKNTLAEYMILSGVDNRPPMLDKDLYDSWKSRMELNMQNRENKRMILESVEHGPLIWPTIKENGSCQGSIRKSSTTNASSCFSKEMIPIDAINKMMSFLSTVVTSRFPSTNNQLRNFSNSRQQETIHDGRVSVQRSGETTSVMLGHMERQCPKPKRKMDATWFGDKVLLVEAQGNAKVLNEEELEFLADLVLQKPRQFLWPTCIVKDHMFSPSLNIFEKEINYLKQTLSEQSKEKELLTKIFNVFKNESKEKEANNIDTEIALEKKVKELENIVCKMGQSAQTVHMLTKPQVFYDNNLKQALGFQNLFYLKKAQQIRPMLYDGSVIPKETNVISIADSEETLMLEEESRSKMLLKQRDLMVLKQKVNIKPINYAKLNRLSKDFGKRFVPQQELSDEQALHPDAD